MIYKFIELLIHLSVIKFIDFSIYCIEQIDCFIKYIDMKVI